ncbi:MAG: hypothetical protein LBI47_01520 [Puniceicoccales bacterium]|jgi:hypothetical protein|nr:hypothetical protein [Puniceicoccales bacterium]
MSRSKKLPKLSDDFPWPTRISAEEIAKLLYEKETDLKTKISGVVTEDGKMNVNWKLTDMETLVYELIKSRVDSHADIAQELNITIV